jgi:hypothetical protein
MDSNSAAKVADALKRGTFPDVQPWDIGAGIQSIVDEIEGRSKITAAEVESAARTLVANRHYDHARTLAQAWVKTRGFEP